MRSRLFVSLLPTVFACEVAVGCKFGNVCRSVVLFFAGNKFARICVRVPVRNQVAANAVKIIVLKRQFKASVEM